MLALSVFTNSSVATKRITAVPSAALIITVLSLKSSVLAAVPFATSSSVAFAILSRSLPRSLSAVMLFANSKVFAVSFASLLAFSNKLSSIFVLQCLEAQ